MAETIEISIESTEVILSDIAEETTMVIESEVVMEQALVGTASSGTIYVYVDNILQQTIVSADLNAEVVNIII